MDNNTISVQYPHERHGSMPAWGLIASDVSICMYDGVGQSAGPGIPGPVSRAYVEIGAFRLWGALSTGSVGFRLGESETLVRNDIQSNTVE